jgi:hypothetical protein
VSILRTVVDEDVFKEIAIDPADLSDQTTSRQQWSSSSGSDWGDTSDEDGSTFTSSGDEEEYSSTRLDVKKNFGYMESVIQVERDDEQQPEQVVIQLEE